MIATDSTIVTSPSRIAGMNPAGLMARNSASFSTPASRSTGLSRCASPISSSSQTTRNPLPSPKTVIMFAIPALGAAQFDCSTTERATGANARERGPLEPFRASWTPSLPLDRPRRLARNIVHHAVDALDLVDDAGRDVADEFHVEGIEVRRHAVGRVHGAQADHEIISAPVAHHADGLHRQDHAKACQM